MDEDATDLDLAYGVAQATVRTKPGVAGGTKVTARSSLAAKTSTSHGEGEACTSEKRTTEERLGGGRSAEAEEVEDSATAARRAEKVPPDKTLAPTKNPTTIHVMETPTRPRTQQEDLDVATVATLQCVAAQRSAKASPHSQDGNAQRVLRENRHKA